MIAWSIAVSLTFVWLGMVLAISFLEAPLKFRAPDITLRLGLGIGRLVFRALNSCELLLAVAVAVSFLVRHPAAGALTAYTVATAALLIQLVGVRPLLSKRSDAVLAGHEGPRSHAHLVYVAFEVVKVVALVSTGALLLNGYQN